MPDRKRKAAMFASLGAAVVVVAVIVFLVLNASGRQHAGQNSEQSQPSATSGAPKPVPGSAAPEELGKAKTDSPVTNFNAAGKVVTDFFNSPGSDTSWNVLTPAAKKVFGTQQDFQQYWTQHKIDSYDTARADSRGPNADGSLTMNLNVNGVRYGYRIVTSGGQLLIDSNMRLQ
jgi:hypothetical protein